MSVTGPMKYLTIGDSTYEVYNTDTKVTQTYATASGYTYWRPLVVGYSSGSAETSTPATTTNTTYVFDTIKVKPSDGIIRFGAAALYNGDYTTTISADTLTAARTLTAPDKSGTIALTSDISTAIGELPTPMSFKGSVGTGGTITSLPAAAAANEGYTYKVITDLSTPVTAKVGDTVISNGSSWIVIPSGDEPSGTVTSVGLSNATNGGLTISGSPITSSGLFTIGHSNVLTSAQTTQAIYPIKIDKNGHISDYGSAVSVTDEKVKYTQATSSVSFYPLVTSQSSATSTANTIDGFEIWQGNTSSANFRRLMLGNPLDFTSADGAYGTIRLYGTGINYYGDLNPGTIGNNSLTANRTWTLPDKTGTVALTSDIPTVPTISLNGSSTTSASFYAPTSAGTLGQVLTSNGSGAPIWSAITVPTKTSDLTNDSGFITGMTILSYGSSTWQNFIDAYDANKVVYCRASSNSNPASGSQTRLAFMAYVNNATTPTEVEFQYYRSVSTHTASQQGDQVYVYKLNKTNGWSVTVREASVKVVAGTGLGGTYSNGTMTLTGPTISLNGSSTTSVSFYAPTSAGTDGYVLKSNGSGAPTWATDFQSTTATLTVAGWSSSSQTVSVSEITATSIVIVSPAPASYDDYTSAGIYCSAQGSNTLTFTCTTTPSNAITVNILYR